MELNLIKELYGRNEYNKALKANRKRSIQHENYLRILKEKTDILKAGGSLLTPSELKECETIENKGE